MRRRSCQKIRQASRRGNVLVLVAILLFVLLPLASLVLQSGWLTLTRRQMQTGVDTAALEALRGRDALSDVDRNAARLLIETVYDDDLDDSNGDTMNFGAGPTVAFSGGIALPDTDFQASRLITGVGTYQPMLAANLGNDAAGDIVAGDYDENATTHSESGTYARTDFAASSAGDVAMADSAIVRLRRSGETFGVGVGSSGPTVPFLFGRGPSGGPGIAGDDEIDFMSFAERGAIVRATSIAHAVPAWTVGHRSSGIVGVADFTIDAAIWQAAVAASGGATTTLTVDVDPLTGVLTESAMTSVVGFVTNHDTTSPVSVGTELRPNPGGLAISNSVYVPLVTDFPAGVDWFVCGVVPAQVSGSGTGPWVVTASATARPIAVENAAATMPSGNLAALSTDQVNHVLDRLHELTTDAAVRDTLLHSPALRRAVP